MNDLISAELLEVAAENPGKWLVVCGAHLIDRGNGPVYDTYDEALFGCS